MKEAAVPAAAKQDSGEGQQEEKDEIFGTNTEIDGDGEDKEEDVRGLAGKDVGYSVEGIGKEEMGVLKLSGTSMVDQVETGNVTTQSEENSQEEKTKTQTASWGRRSVFGALGYFGGSWEQKEEMKVIERLEVVNDFVEEPKDEDEGEKQVITEALTADEESLGEAPPLAANGKNDEMPLSRASKAAWEDSGRYSEVQNSSTSPDTNHFTMQAEEVDADTSMERQPVSSDHGEEDIASESGVKVVGDTVMADADSSFEGFGSEDEDAVVAMTKEPVTTQAEKPTKPPIETDMPDDKVLKSRKKRKREAAPIADESRAAKRAKKLHRKSRKTGAVEEQGLVAGVGECERAVEERSREEKRQQKQSRKQSRKAKKQAVNPANGTPSAGLRQEKSVVGDPKTVKGKHVEKAQVKQRDTKESEVLDEKPHSKKKSKKGPTVSNFFNTKSTEPGSNTESKKQGKTDLKKNQALAKDKRNGKSNESSMTETESKPTPAELGRSKKARRRKRDQDKAAKEGLVQSIEAKPLPKVAHDNAHTEILEQKKQKKAERRRRKKANRLARDPAKVSHS